jgi:Lon protease-like protein
MLKPDSPPPPEVLSALPIFPLPNVVLLPGMVLPLNVFEPRYLELVDHVMSDGLHIGVPLLRPGYERDYDGRPPIEEIFGIGRLLAHHRFPDGRRFIRLEGLGRVRLTRELEPRRSFREVEAVALPEEPSTDAQSLEILKAQVERVACLCPDDGEMIDSLLSITDARVFSYAVSALLPSIELMNGAPVVPSGRCAQVEILQECLAAESTDARIRLLVARTGVVIAGLSANNLRTSQLLN